MKNTGNAARNQRGEISEMAIGISILLFCGFFPLANLAYATCVYFVGCCYNDAESRELSVHRQKDFAAVQQSTLSQFGQTGLSQFIFHGPPRIRSSYSVDVSKGTVTDSSTITVSPFLPMPMIPNVPGLSADMTFTITQTRPQDEIR